MLACVLAVVLAALGTSTGPAFADSPVTGPACEAVGWWPVLDASGAPMGSVSSLAGALGPQGTMYAGSRVTTDGRATLYSFDLGDLRWRAEQRVTGLSVTDALATPGRTPELWVSTLDATAGFNGPVLGGSSGADLAPLGTLRSWVMRLAATDTDVFVAVQRPENRGVYGWDGAAADWRLQGGADIDTSVFYDLEAGSDGRLWLGTDRRGVWRSPDAGVTWQAVGDDGATVWSLATPVGAAQRVLAGLGTPEGGGGIGTPKGIRLTQDGGETWQLLAPGASANRNDVLRNASLVTALAFSAGDPAVAFAAAWDDGLFLSRDGGTTWQYLDSPAGQRGYFEALITLIPGNETECELLVAGGAGGVWVRNIRAQHETVYLPHALKKVTIK